MPAAHAVMWHLRQRCADGAFDLTGFIESVRLTGYNEPWDIEMLSEKVKKTLDALATLFTTSISALSARS